MGLREFRFQVDARIYVRRSELLSYDYWGGAGTDRSPQPLDAA
jgi:hypothetical protein